MADGTRSRSFNFPIPKRSQLRPGEIVVDLFAGGGGASTALEQALGRPVDIAINHNPWAVAMHAANHPLTTHLCQDVWEADPRKECAGKSVGWLHASPDCTHFSQAKGGQPRSRATRSLSWVVLRWAGSVRPRLISLENVKEILKWGPLVAKRCKDTGRVVKLDGGIAAPGERTPIDQQFLIPDKRHAGRTWRHFIRALRRLGYAVEWQRLKACDYGAGTSRERLFLVARRDGQPIVWPQPTHGPDATQPHIPAAACIDWSIPSPSIFTRKKPLADATLRRIARGVKRYVIDAKNPFIVGDVAPVITEHANSSNARSWRADEPLRTQCAGVKGGHFALAAATLVQTGYGERDGQDPRSLDIGKPLGTVVAGGVKHAVASASLVKFRGASDGAAITEPLPTITSGAGAARPAGAAHALGVVTTHLEEYDGTYGRDSAGDQRRALPGALRRNDMAAEVPRPLGPGEACDTTSRGASASHRVSRAEDGCCEEAALGLRPPAGVDGAPGTDPGGHADQPQRRRQGEQPSSESGDRDLRREPRARLPHWPEAAGEVLPGAGAGERGAEGEGAEGARKDLPGDRYGTGDSADDSIQSRALRVAAFLVSYYGQGQALSLGDPLDTITTRDRLALVTVHVQGVPHVIVDIGLRMLKPHELYAAQGFPPHYIIDRTADGRAISISRSVAMVGNSVSPPPLRAIAQANLDTVQERMAA